MAAALIVLLLILIVFGAGGLALHVLWYLLIAAVILWLIGFFLRGASGGRGRWYRW
ncbi:MAG: hydrophobic protein [Candidatus Dormibacterales bacterium]